MDTIKLKEVVLNIYNSDLTPAEKKKALSELAVEYSKRSRLALKYAKDEVGFIYAELENE